MDTLTRYLARKADRVALGLWMCILASGLLSGCAKEPQSFRTPIERLDFSAPASSTSGVQQGLLPRDYDPKTVEREEQLGLSESQSKALGCNIGDRFDRKSTLAYNFADQQTQLALNLSIDGPQLDDPGNFHVNSVYVRYTHKFSKPPQSKREKCRFQSSFQGLVGSAYNEFFVRNTYTVWKELRNKLRGD